MVKLRRMAGGLPEIAVYLKFRKGVCLQGGLWGDGAGGARMVLMQYRDEGLSAEWRGAVRLACPSHRIAVSGHY